MTPDDLIHAAPAIAKSAGALAAAIPFTAIVKRMLGPAADEVAQMWVDQVRVYRYGRQLKLLEKAERMARDAGFTPQAVPPKILFPLLEGASFEENEDLHTMWAALLANAASPESENIVRSGFLASLRELSHDEAAMLNWMFDQAQLQFQKAIDDIGANPQHPYLATFSRVILIQAYCAIGYARPGADGETVSYLDLQTCLEGLQAAQLVQRRFDASDSESDGDRYSFTARGHQFVTACRPPKSNR